MLQQVSESQLTDENHFQFSLHWPPMLTMTKLENSITHRTDHQTKITGKKTMYARANGKYVSMIDNNNNY